MSRLCVSYAGFITYSDFSYTLLGTVKTGEYIDWALTELEAGADTRNLRVLAGLSPLDSHFEVEFYFQRALHDRGFELPNEDTHLEEYVREVLHGVVSGEIEP